MDFHCDLGPGSHIPSPFAGCTIPFEHTRYALLGTNEDDFPFLTVGYVSSLEGSPCIWVIYYQAHLLPDYQKKKSPLI